MSLLICSWVDLEVLLFSFFFCFSVGGRVRDLRLRFVGCFKRVWLRPFGEDLARGRRGSLLWVTGTCGRGFCGVGHRV